MDVKYDLDGYNCVTECPFGCRTPLCKGIINVGSTACNNCKYFVDDDDENHIVKCKYKDMEERTFKLSLDKAKMWYNGSSQDLKRIALEVYTEEELTKVELPNNLYEYSDNISPSQYKEFKEDLETLEIFPNLKALYILKALRDCYRQGWKPDWEKTEYKYVIVKNANTIEKFSSTLSNTFLSFQSSEIRDKFLDNFKDLIEEADDLI